MARTTEDIKIASHVVPGKSPNYSSAPALYREAKLGQKQKFGYYFNDGMARTTPTRCRVVLEMAEALRRQGHECAEFELPSRTLPTSRLRVELLLNMPQPRRRPRWFVALASALGSEDFFKNKGPDPMVSRWRESLAWTSLTSSCRNAT